MDKQKYIDYIQSKYWQKVRLELFKVRGKKCEVCGETKLIHVHHLTYENLFNEKPEDLQILCKKHHEEAHGRKFSKYKRKKPKTGKIKVKPTDEQKRWKKELKKQKKRMRKEAARRKWHY